MIVFPNCKINIGLFITDKRADGFHNLESIFAPVDWTDILEVNFSDTDTSLKVSGLQVTSMPEENIVFKAFQLLKDRFDIGNVNMHLHKNLPSGAGLGGGSADASFALKAMNDLFQLQLSNDALKELANTLGADCPFFIENKTAFVSGKGDVFEDISLDLSSYYLAVVKPDFHVNTKEAFAGIEPQRPSFDLRSLPKLEVQNWKLYVKNDFEATVGKIYPEIFDLKEKFYNAGALYASMSGSGSAVYGIFNEKPEITFAPAYIGRFL